MKTTTTTTPPMRPQISGARVQLCRYSLLAILCGVLALLGLAQPGSAQTLLLRYSFDEATSGTANAYDSSGASPQADATFVGTATRSTTTAGATPVAALDTASTTGHVSAGDVDKLDALPQMTLTAWVRCYGNPNNGQAIMGKMAPGTPTQGWGLLFGNSSTGAPTAAKFSIKLRINGTTSATSADLSGDNSWVFVAAAYDGSISTANLKFYTGRATTAVSQSGSTKNFAGGTPTANADSFRAPSYGTALDSPFIMMDDVRVYNGVLTLTQLEAIRQANFPPALSWDVDGANPGAGGGAPAETWSGGGVWAANNNWSSSTNGDLSGQQWSDGSVANFAAGGDATGTYTVTVANSPSASAVNIQEGAVTFNESSVTLMGNKAIDVAAGSSATFDSTTLAGTAGLNKTGDGTLTLGQANPLSGFVTVSGGTLALGAGGSLDSASTIKPIVGTTYDVSAVSGGYVLLSGQTLRGQGTINGSVTVASGATLAPGGSVGTITFNNDLILAGDLFIELDKSLAISNDVAVVTGVLTNAGTGTLTVTNLGATPLVAGDRFTLFSQLLANGSALTIVSDGGVVWTNRLEEDGSIEVVSVPAAGPSYLGWAVTGGNSLGFAWTNANVKLQAQTNASGILLGDTNWHDYPDGASSPVNVTIDPASPPVFFRLISQ